LQTQNNYTPPQWIYAYASVKCRKCGHQLSWSANSWQSAEDGLERDRNAHKCKITEAQEQEIKAKMKAKRESDGFYNFTEELNYYNALRA